MALTNRFDRIEKKFLLTEEQYTEFLRRTADILIPDEHGKTRICNLYFDTPDFHLIRRSIEKPIYKEKMRLRTYGVPTPQTPAYIELKKKYLGIVYKRRVGMSYAQAIDYLCNGKQPPVPSQITNEIDYFLSHYSGIAPRYYISYIREAFFHKDDHDFRITFDSDLTWRVEDLDLTLGSYGGKLIGEREYIMEIKIQQVMPLWMCHLFEELGIRPKSFSKVGSAFTQHYNETKRSTSI